MKTTTLTENKMGKIEDKLNEMGIELPVEPPPIANYVPGVRTGNLLYLSGLGPSAVASARSNSS